jgi:hypothetical protein
MQPGAAPRTTRSAGRASLAGRTHAGALARLAQRYWPPLKLSLTAWGIVLFPLIAGIILFRYAVQHGAWGYDFKATIYDPGKAVLHGQSPYPDATLASLAGRPTFVYPPLLLWVDAPLALLPILAARIVWTVVLEVAVAAAMAVLRVRDWRCYAVALLSVPTLSGLIMGNVTIALVLGLALAWRSRDRWLIGGITIGLVVAIKLLLWPLFVWLVATRRFRMAGTAVITGSVAALSSWAAIGFSGLSEYTHLLHIVATKTAGPRAFSIATLAHEAGLSSTLGHSLQRLCGAAAIGYALFAARGQDGDRRAFSAALVGALVISPVVWLHYPALLLVPVAIMSPRLGPAWAVPGLFWPIIWTGGHVTTVGGAGGSSVLVGITPSPVRLVIALTLIAAAYAVTAIDWTQPGFRAYRQLVARRTAAAASS